MTRGLRAAVLAGALVLTACGSTLQESTMVTVTVPAAPGTAGTVTDAAQPGETSAGSLAGGGSGNAGTAAGGAGAVGGSATAVAGAAVTDPISLGFIVGKDGGGANLGLQPAGTLRANEVYAALVAAYNEAGGIAGRRIEPVYAPVDGGATDYNAEGQAACERLTRDAQVAAVLSVLITYNATFEACLAQTSTPHVEGSFVTGGDRELAAYPLIIAPGALSVDRRLRAMVDVSVADGWLTTANRVGVLLDDCPHSRRAYEASLIPALQAHGMTVTKLNALRCTTGIGSASDAAAAMQNFVLSFKQAGVDRLITISDFESVAVLLFMQSADSQRYYPGYVLSSVSGVAALVANVPPDQLPGVHGAGWIAPADITTPVLGTGYQRCLDMLSAHGVQVRTSGDMYLGAAACETMFLVEAALTATRGDAAPATLVAAMAGSGATYGHPVLTAPSALGPARHDGAGAAQAFAYDASCSCMRYRGAPLAVP